MANEPVAKESFIFFQDIVSYLRRVYGVVWSRQVNIYLLLGSSDIIEHLSPGLSLDGWQEREGTVLIWGGEVPASGVDSELVRGFGYGAGVL